MRNYMRLLEGLIETYHDDDHQDALERTGFWGQAGAGCVFLARDTGRLLLAHRSEGCREPHTWGTWGGAIDPGEDPAEATRREAAEEAGFRDHCDLVPLYVFKSGTFTYYNFLAIVDSEFKPRLNWENQDYEWCAWGEWPHPLHSGLEKMLNDPKSAKTIQAEIARSSNLTENAGQKDLKGYVNLCMEFGMLISMNMVHLDKKGRDANAAQELLKVVQTVQRPAINGQKFSDVMANDPALVRNPKAIPHVLQFIYQTLAFIRPRFERFLNDQWRDKMLTRLETVERLYKEQVQYLG